ncbi:Rrf2 family transcriptional regulator [Marinomonas aquiplantarum]|uniref:Rrf2 family protein n=1 Tax=Marinomonas aquiplantarum TaxID=491951 RepID=A0A366CVK2_9GAMM|nr:Rrf2 family transcriptional regulator [Marinomonas aquiplantarum]RBO81872.1 Rrf2 family protein [Marinomonas aquiplantarum]
MSNSNTQFSIAVHVLVGIAKYGKVNSNELAESVNANPIFIKRILAKLSSSGLVSSSSGRNGGSVLARHAEKITLLDVYKAVEAPKAFMVHSYPKNMSCKISTHIQSAMGDVLDDVQIALEERLKSTSVYDMLEKVAIEQ